MKDKIQSKAVSIKNHVNRHRFAYGVAVGLMPGLYLSNLSGRQITEFLVEKGIDPTEFFCPEAYAENLI